MPSTTTTISSPPLSPRLSEKKSTPHHARRRSGKEAGSAEKKSVRPAPMTRRATHTTGNSGSGKKSTREREREKERGRERDGESDGGRDSGESFPQFCMTCEKQFLPADSTFLYCSEACRLHDLNPYPLAYAASHTSTYALTSPPLTPSYTSPYNSARPFSTLTTTPFSPADGPDIIPRFSPTISRPRSYFHSDPYPSSPLHQTTHSQSYNPTTSRTALGSDSSRSPSPSPGSSPSSSHKSSHHQHTSSNHHKQHSSALASLRDLATALPKSKSKSSSPRTSSKASSRPHPLRSRTQDSHSYIPAQSRARNSTQAQTPPKSSSSSYISLSRPSSAVWSYIPFTSSAAPSAQAQVQTPGSSYSQEAGFATATTAGYGASGTGYVTGVSVGAYSNTGGMGMDRPLPPRGGPGGYGHRPRSVDLVTPWVGY